MARLELKSVTKIYPGGEQAISNLSLEVQEGEFVVLVGQNGSGKSTLLRLIAGLDSFTDGALYLDGKEITNAATKERDVSLMTQSNAPNANLSVYDNLAHGLKMRKVAPELIDVRVKTTAELFGLTADLQKKPKMLTAAARRQIALGRIVAREPKIMMFDEPFSNLDGELRARMCAELVKLHVRLKGTFLYATDNLSEAMTLATRIVVMRDGQIVQDGTPLEVYTHPRTRFVADLIGSPAINLFDGAALVREDGKLLVKFLKQSVALPESVAQKLVRSDEDYGKAVCFGIRPEDVHMGGEIPARVVRVEGDYAECELNYDSDWLPNRAKITALAHGVKEGDEISLAIDAEHALLFDGESGVTVID